MYYVQFHGILYNNVVRRAAWRAGILLTCGKHLHDHIISLIGEFCSLNISLNSTISYLSTCTKPGHQDIMCFGVRITISDSFYAFDIWFLNLSVYYFCFSFYSFYWFLDGYKFSLTRFVIKQTTYYGFAFLCLV